MTLDVTKMCAAKSDQINAIDLVSGPRIAKITEVKLFSETEQPVHVVLDGDSKRPWKCSKTSVRTLAALYGNDASQWIGKHIEIYCDETVLWGGQAVGGIRQSKAEGIKSPKKLMLTKSRTKKETTVINPLTEDEIARHYNKDDSPAAQPKPDAPAIDKDALFSDARENAALGRKDFGKWFKTKTKPEQDALKEIGAEVTELLDAAEALPAE